jgi:hypothetical protein
MAKDKISPELPPLYGKQSWVAFVLLNENWSNNEILIQKKIIITKIQQKICSCDKRVSSSPPSLPSSNVDVVRYKNIYINNIFK